MATIPQVAGALREVLGPVAERAARATGFVRRASTLTGGRFVQALVFGWLGRPCRGGGRRHEAGRAARRPLRRGGAGRRPCRAGGGRAAAARSAAAGRP